MSDELGFDIDAGVDSIAADMGWDSNDDDNDDNGIVAEKSTEEDTKEHEEEATEEVEETEVVTKEPPASWSKEQHENWSKVPKEAQDYIELREKQMLDGIEQYKAGNQFAQEMAKVVEPFRAAIDKHVGGNELQAIHNLFSHQQVLTEGSLESRQNAFLALGKSLGLIPEEGQAQPDQRTVELQQRVERMEQQERQRADKIRTEQYNKVSQEVEAFATDKANEHFELVADDVVLLLNTGLDLKTAYERAVWANPITRAKEMAKTTEAQSKAAAKKNTEAAKQAQRAKSANVKAIKSNHQPTEVTGSWDETMMDVIRKSRNA
jgi:hypothetical protein